MSVNIELGRRALRALGGRRFRGMTVAASESSRHQYTLVINADTPDRRCWGSSDGLFWQDELMPAIQSALDPATGWLVLDEAALGALLAVANEMPRPVSGSTGEDATTALVAYCHGRSSIADVCKRLVAAIEAAREDGR